MSDIALRVEGLGKQYRLGLQENGSGMYRYKSMRDALTGIARRPLQTIKSAVVPEPMNEENSFWALKDINFEVKKGEVVGIIGRNGAGKSTLLKILSQITKPTTGRVDLFGRVGSLLEVGTGFHPELSGRENIYLNGAILGMSRTEVRGRFDEIVAFSEIEKFLDTPVKHYSSGMYTRLAFAVAANLQSEILVVDEVLAVGDSEFQKKCLGKMKDLSNSGRTVIFVSHNMNAVSSLCEKCVLLNSGLVEACDETHRVINHYLFAGQTSALHKTFPAGNGPIEVEEFGVSQNGNTLLQTDLPVEINVRVKSKTIPIHLYICGFTIYDDAGTPAMSSFFNDLGEASEPRMIDGENRMTCTIPAHFLNEGTYRIVLDVGIANVQRYTTDDVHSITFEMTNLNGIGSRFGLGKRWRNSLILPLLNWEALPRRAEVHS